jgi:hypothetical protein
MSPEARRAVFLKLEHDGPIDLSGTGLKAVAEPSERYTLAVPRAEDLSALSTKIDVFATAVPRKGAVPNSRLVTAIETIAMGSPEDRLSQELLERYAELVTQEFVICEVELLSLEQGKNRQREDLAAMRHLLKTALDRDRGGFGAMFEQEEIRGTCRIVIRCSGRLFESLVQASEWQRRIYWFEARPEFQTFNSIVSNFDMSSLGDISAPSEDATTICVIDSGVSAGNPFMQSVVKEGLLKSFLLSAPNDPSDGYGHGTGVASLAAYYALNLAPDATNSAKVWIASARILTAQNQLEDERLFSKILREVVAYFMPKGIKIFNLSVNDRHLSWNINAKRTHPRRSWTARTIDQLSREFDVIFVVSTGNMVAADVRGFHSSGKAYPAYFAEDEACILDPGQSAYALTVGSIAPSTLAEGATARSRAIALTDEASPFTRCGPGIRKEIKPEVVDYGGNFLLDEESGQVRANRGLSLPVASNQLSPAIRFDAGTSLAAPRVSHKLALVLQDVRQLGFEPSAALLKAFLVNSSRHPLGTAEQELFKEGVGSGHLPNVMGHGLADDIRATGCDPYSVLLYFQGEISPDQICFFDVPVPAKLQEAGRVTKRLSVTVVFGPEVQRWGLEQYFGTNLKWRMYRGNVSQEEIVTAMSKPDEESVAEELSEASTSTEEANGPNELKFELGITRRSRGTVQHDVATWSLHKAEYSDHPYTLAIIAHEKWSSASDKVSIGVVVRLEETSQTTEIYNEVQTALVNLEIRTSVRT